MAANQQDSVETRLNRLETLFANVGEMVVAQNSAINTLTERMNQQSNAIDTLTVRMNEHNDTIDVLVENIKESNENYRNLSEQTYLRFRELSEQAAEDRQQAAIDRQQAEQDRQAWQEESRRVWEYLLGKQGT
ncbi:hypothetical protein RIVM261_043980 [Rivularia sp. IAM M-261]|nr:hypothetical protein RIVM261_043980 [Rivularia sp. IAM M-261]